MGQMLYKKAKLQRYAGWPDWGIYNQSMTAGLIKQMFVRKL